MLSLQSFDEYIKLEKLRSTMKKKQSSILSRIAIAQTKKPYIILTLLLLLTVLFSIPAQDVRTVASLEQMMPRDTTEIASFNTLRDEGLGRDAIAVIIRTNKDSYVERETIFGEDTKKYVERLDKELQTQTSITKTQHYLNHEGMVNHDQTETLYIAYTDAAADNERMKQLATYLRELTEEGVPAGTTILLTGTPIIQQTLGELIQEDQRKTRIASTIFVLLITALLFGFTSSLIPIITVTLSVTWLYGTMGLLDLPISTLAGGVAAMVIGIGIDFAIHLMNKFKFERKEGLSIPDAIEHAVMHTGSALSITALTTGAAFLSFLVGVMPEMGRFGILMALGIFYSLIITLTALPALLVIEEQLIKRWAKKARFGIEKEYKIK